MEYSIQKFMDEPLLKILIRLKKTLYHFWPGSKAYSIAIAVCNFIYRFCQNWDISKIISDEIFKYGQKSTQGKLYRRQYKQDIKLLLIHIQNQRFCLDIAMIPLVLRVKQNFKIFMSQKAI